MSEKQKIIDLDMVANSLMDTTGSVIIGLMKFTLSCIGIFLGIFFSVLLSYS